MSQTIKDLLGIYKEQNLISYDLFWLRSWQNSEKNYEFLFPNSETIFSIY